MFTAGTVVALGLSNGECPVGIVTRCDNQWVTLKLFDWLVGLFSGFERTYRVDLVMSWQTAGQLGASEKLRQGYDSTETVFDMDALGDFQTWWSKPGETT